MTRYFVVMHASAEKQINAAYPGCVVGFANLDFRTYSGVQHSIGPQELQDIRAFILDALPEQAQKVPTRSAAD